MTRFLTGIMGTVVVGCVAFILMAMAIGHLDNTPNNELVFSATLRPHHSDLYRMDLAHQLMIRLTDGDKIYSSPIWSPDGQQIAFVSIIDYPVDTLYLMDAQGGQVHSLQYAPAGDDFSPTWSADGRFIAYISFRFAYAPELMLTDAHNGMTQRLTNNRVNESSPTWSPDNRHITYVSDLADSKDIYNLDVETGISRPLIATLENDDYPTWSPDGRYLLYISGTPKRIYLWDSLQMQSLLLYASNFIPNSTPDWSADGQYLIYAAGITSETSGIFRLDVASCLQQPNSCNPQLLTFTPGVYQKPRWRPKPL